MPVTYKKIASVTVTGATAASMDFNSIPGTYTDLVLKVSARGNLSLINTDIRISFNGSTTSFSFRNVQGNGSAASSVTFSQPRIGHVPDAGSTASTFGNTEVYIPNYAGSTNKSYSSDSVQENNSATAGDTLMQLIAGLWSNTAAITSISLTLGNSESFVTNSTATLYGISKS